MQDTVVMVIRIFISLMLRLLGMKLTKGRYHVERRLDNRVLDPQAWAIPRLRPLFMEYHWDRSCPGEGLRLISHQSVHFQSFVFILLRICCVNVLRLSSREGPCSKVRNVAANGSQVGIPRKLFIAISSVQKCQQGQRSTLYPHSGATSLFPQ